jgi:hypothetical protein
MIVLLSGFFENIGKRNGMGRRVRDRKVKRWTKNVGIKKRKRHTWELVETNSKNVKKLN